MVAAVGANGLKKTPGSLGCVDRVVGRRHGGRSHLRYQMDAQIVAPLGKSLAAAEIQGQPRDRAAVVEGVALLFAPQPQRAE